MSLWGLTRDVSRLPTSVGISMPTSTCGGIVTPVGSAGEQAMYNCLIKSLLGSSRPGDAICRSILFREGVETENGSGSSASELEGCLKSVISKPASEFWLSVMPGLVTVGLREELSYERTILWFTLFLLLLGGRPSSHILFNASNSRLRLSG